MPCQPTGDPLTKALSVRYGAGFSILEKGGWTKVPGGRRLPQGIPGGPLIQLSRTIEGRRTLSTIRELSPQIIVWPPQTGAIQGVLGDGT